MSPETRPYTLRKRADAMAATRERITEAAVDLHGSIGPSRTTITAVAERAGVQRQTVYRHFATDADLFAACSGHFAQLHPRPSIAAWRAIADPEQRLARALDELYAFYEATGAMWANVFRDEPLVPAIGPNLARFRGYLDDAARALAEGRAEPERAMLLAATRHAVDFHTWRSLARDGELRRSQAVELVSAMVRRRSPVRRRRPPRR